MIAITTKYLGPTNFRGSRVVAISGNDHRLTMHWDDALSPGENHAAAAKALAAKYGWQGNWHSGGLKTGWAFVVESSPAFTVTP